MTGDSLHISKFMSLNLCYFPTLRNSVYGSRNISEKIQRLAKETSNFRSPELINDGAKIAPSKRIIEVFPEYHLQKVFLGTLLTSEIGIPTLKANCLHFREWIERLETLCN